MTSIPCVTCQSSNVSWQFRRKNMTRRESILNGIKPFFCLTRQRLENIDYWLPYMVAMEIKTHISNTGMWRVRMAGWFCQFNLHNRFHQVRIAGMKPNKDWQISFIIL